MKKKVSEIKIKASAIEVKAPNKYDKGAKKLSIFCGGTIDEGNSFDWQAELVKELKDEDILFLNPRREHWDASLKQDIHNKTFKEQVEWELNALEACDVIVMYFAKGSKSPISLLELGLHARDNKLIVLCPDGFWRKGNVDIVCANYDIVQVDSFEKLIKEIKKHL